MTINKSNNVELILGELLKRYPPKTILDVGSGHNPGYRRMMEEAGCVVTGIDRNPEYKADITGEFTAWDFGDKTFDWVWVCHVLEHQLNVNQFLRKVQSVRADTGMIIISVPPGPSTIKGGHYTWWNMGLLFYNLVMAGINCREAGGVCGTRNCTVAIPYREMPDPHDLVLKYDVGDIETLRGYFPKWIQDNNLPAGRGMRIEQCFDGDIKEIPWPQ